MEGRRIDGIRLERHDMPVWSHGTCKGHCRSAAISTKVEHEVTRLKRGMRKIHVGRDFGLGQTGKPHNPRMVGACASAAANNRRPRRRGAR